MLLKLLSAKTQIFWLLCCYLISGFPSFAGKIELLPDTSYIEDPFIYVATVRPNQYDSITDEYFPNSISSSDSLTYLKVYKRNGKWLVKDLNSVHDFISDKNNGNKNWIIYVHGDSQTPELAFLRGFQLQEEYRINVIVFSWPSKDPELGGIQNFNNSRNMIEKSASRFVKFLYQLEDWKINRTDEGQLNLSLFLHSLGNYYLERIAKDQLMENFTDKLFNNVIINAAAVNQNGHINWTNEIDFQDRIFINSNRKDITLKGVNILTEYDVQLGEQAIDGFSTNAIYVNFGLALKNELNFGLLHGYYVGVIPGKSKNIFNYYNTIFHGEMVNFSDQDMFIKNDTIPVYDIVF